MKLSVLHITPYFAPAFIYGGPPRSTLGLTKALQQGGLRVQVLTTAANGQQDLAISQMRMSDYDSVPVRYFPRSLPKGFFGSRELAKEIETVMSGYDVVHLHGLWNLPVWFGARQALRQAIPYIISPRGMLDAGSMAHKPWRKKLAFSLLVRKHIMGAAFLHATSDDEARTLKGYGLNDNVFTLPNGIDIPEPADNLSNSIKTKLNLEPATKLIVYLGRLHPTKRLDLLAEAFQLLSTRAPSARLVIAGPNEYKHRQKMERYFTPIQESVIWLGEIGQKEKWLLLQNATALVMCSDSESFGLSVVEALGAGVPVVVTQTCPWQDVAKKKCGFWVSQNAIAIADALTWLLANPDEAKLMGANGKRLVFEKYQWDIIAKQMADYYVQAVNIASNNVESRIAS